MILTSESVDEILWCDHSNETSSAVFSHGTIYSRARGAPWVNKFGNPLIRKILVLTSAYVHPSVRPSVQTLGEGDGSPKTA